MKKIKPVHTPKSSKGMGDFYGTGHRNPLGKIRTGFGDTIPMSKKKLKSPPKSLA